MARPRSCPSPASILTASTASQPATYPSLQLDMTCITAGHTLSHNCNDRQGQTLWLRPGSAFLIRNLRAQHVFSQSPLWERVFTYPIMPSAHRYLVCLLTQDGLALEKEGSSHSTQPTRTTESAAIYRDRFSRSQSKVSSGNELVELISRCESLRRLR